MIDQNIPFDLNEFGAEIPDIPQNYIDLITEWSGHTEGKPNARIVKGTDPAILDWCVKGWVPRYSFPEVTEHTYHILHKPDGTKKILNPLEATVYSNSKKLKGIILPVTETSVKDHLIPRYFVEIYRPSIYFGNPVVWNHLRYGTDSDTGETIDILGEFPYDGNYETWFCIEELVRDSNDNPIKSVFRPLDETVMEFIRSQIQNAKLYTRAEQHKIEFEKQQEANRLELERRKSLLRYKLNERIDRIVGTGSSLRTK